MEDTALGLGLVPKQLQFIVDEMAQAAEMMKVTSILQELSFPSINDRFRGISESAPATFEWIFSRPDWLLQEQKGLKISFTDWLRRGHGIFHIAGKPGAGKSTLMKFLCEHGKVEPLLQEWAGARGLLTASFFLWKIGSADQNSLRGLIRGLLFAVIQQEPDLARLLFPRLWNKFESKEKRQWRQPAASLADREISGAFDNITENETFLAKYRMCIFIDGLDELEEVQGVKHYHVATQLKKWAAKSNGHLKFCISSREIPVFEGTFDAAQRIVVQTFTHNDIKLLVSQKLEGNPLFQERARVYPGVCEQVVKDIIDGASGMFLWVSLLVTQIEDALANHDSIEMLQKIVREAPPELEHFLQSILDSVQVRYRVSAYSIFGIVLRYNGILLSRPSESSCGTGIIPVHLSNVGCFLLFDASDRGMLANLPVSGDDFLQAIAEAPRELMPRLESCLKARCKGLLACVGDHVEFTHRSIPEFLQRALNRIEMNSVRDNLIAERLAWVLLAEIEFWFPMRSADTANEGMIRMRSEAVSSGPSATWRNIIWLVGQCMPQVKNKEPQFQLFKILRAIDERCLMLHHHDSTYPFDHHSHLSEIRETECDYGLHGLRSLCIEGTRFPLLSEALCVGLHEYVAWELTTNLRLKKNKYYLINALITFAADQKYQIGESQTKVLETVLQHGFPADQRCPAYLDHHLNPRLASCLKTIWHRWLDKRIYCDLGLSPRKTDMANLYLNDHTWHQIRLWLRYGAIPDITVMLRGLRLWPKVTESDIGGGVTDASTTNWELHLTFGQDSMQKHSIIRPLTANPSISALRQLFGEVNFSITLEDWARYQNPPGADEIIRLAQRSREHSKRVETDQPSEKEIEEAAGAEVDTQGMTVAAVPTHFVTTLRAQLDGWVTLGKFSFAVLEDIK